VWLWGRRDIRGLATLFFDPVSISAK